MAKIGVGVVGLGRIFEDNHLPQISACPDMELVAVADVTESRRARWQNSINVPVYDDMQAILADDEIQLVLILTPSRFHHSHVLAALRAGKHVMVEKPMACSISECEKMVAIAREHNARLVVNNPRRYHVVYQWLREQILSGIWGDPQCIWMQCRGIGLGCIGTHSFDLPRFLTNREIREVTAWVDNPLGDNPRGTQFIDPGGLVVLNMEGGLKAVVSQIENGSGPRFFEINMNRARIHIDEKLGKFEIVCRNNNKSVSYTHLTLPTNREV